jgi:GNAT superfamily N-acetyltransferase
MTTPSTLWKIGTHWATRFGCPVELLAGPEITAVEHAALARWEGAYLFVHGDACILSVPDRFLPTVQHAINGQNLAAVFTPEFAAALFGDRVDRVIGPAWLGYADRTDFHQVDTSNIRPLTPNDRKTLRRFARDCGDDWRDSGIDLDQSLVFGRFIDGTLVAAGTVEPVSDQILNVGIVTHSDHRNRGHGRAVVCALTQYGLDRGAVMQYRTLESNASSLRIARQIGYQQYGRTIAVRLKEPEPAATAPHDSVDRLQQT